MGQKLEKPWKTVWLLRIYNDLNEFVYAASFRTRKEAFAEGVYITNFSNSRDEEQSFTVHKYKLEE